MPMCVCWACVHKPRCLDGWEEPCSAGRRRGLVAGTFHQRDLARLAAEGKHCCWQLVVVVVLFLFLQAM